MIGAFFVGHGGDGFLGKKDIWMAGEGKFGNMLLEILKKLLNNPKPGSEGIGGAGAGVASVMPPYICSIPKKSKNYDFTPFF